MTDILVVTGLSGGGRSQAADSLEDMGWFVVDNLPVVLIDKVVELSFLKQQLANWFVVMKRRDVNTP